MTPASSFIAPPASAADRAARHLADFAPTHFALQQLLGEVPTVEDLRLAAEWFALPAWVKGAISALDALFLFTCITALKPARSLELGVASGVSTAVLLRALHHARIPLPPGHDALLSLDLHPFCYFDRTRPVGSAADEMLPHLSRRVITGTTSLDVLRLVGASSLGFAFIDADHRHPWPCLDALAILPAMKPGAWLVLHDIDLPAAAMRYEAAHNTKVTWHEHGAQHLFNAWPLERFAGLGPCSNIGLVRCPQNEAEAHALRNSLQSAISTHPWETTPPASTVATVLGALP